jgi:hypothetical protein
MPRVSQMCVLNCVGSAGQLASGQQAACTEMCKQQLLLAVVTLFAVPCQKCGLYTILGMGATSAPDF